MERPTFGQGCCTTPSAIYFWAAMFVVFYGASLLLSTAWPELQRYGDTLILGSLPEPASSISLATGLFTVV